MSKSNMPQKTKFSVAITTQTYQNLIHNTLGDSERAKRFIATISSAVAVNPALQECDAGTILAGALLGESLNLSPSPQLGQFYLVPFECKIKGPDGKTAWLKDENGNNIKDEKGKWVAATEMKAQFVLGYKGYVQLAIRSGFYKHINVLEVKEGEFAHYNPFTEEFSATWYADPYQRAKAKTVGYVALFEYLNGFRKLIYWTKEQMLLHADTYSSAFSAEAMKRIENGEIPENEMWKYSSFWYKDFDGMAKKTMLRQLISKWGVMSTEMQNVFERDYSLMEFDKSGNLIPAPASTDDEQPDIIPPGTPIRPEAAEVVEKIDLNDV